MNTQEVYVGIDVSGRRLDVHTWPKGEGLVGGLRRGGPFGAHSPPAGLVRGGGGGGGYGEGAGGGDLGRRGVAGGGGQSPAGAGFCPRHRPLGEDRPVGRGSHRPLCQGRQVPDADSQRLSELLARRRQLVEMLTAEQNRLRSTQDPALCKGVQAHIRWLKDALSKLEKELSATIRQSPLWRAKDELLRSAPGIGPVVSCTLIAELPELGRLGRRESSTPCRVGLPQASQVDAWPPAASAGRCAERP